MIQAYVDGIVFEQQAYGGVSRIFHEILPRMCDYDNNLRLSLLTSGPLRQNLPVHPQITHKALPPVDRLLQPGRFFWLQKQKIRAWVQRLYIPDSKNKIWHSTYYTLPFHWQGLTVVTVHDFINERFPQLFQGSFYKHFVKLKQEAILSADLVICNSYTTKQDIYNFYNINPNNLHVTYWAYGSVFKKLKEDQPDKLKPFFLYIGSRNEYKNFVQLLTAYSHWPGRNDVDLVVVGSAWTNAEHKQLTRRGIMQHVRLLSNVDDKQLCQLYNRASAFIYPSLYEGFGVPLLEAMACGCPIIASRIPSTQEIAGECPIYFELSETNSLLQAFGQVLTEGNNSERTKQGLTHAKRFSWEKTAKQTLDLYKTLLAPTEDKEIL
jgi:glycosyltransferase involved in cell wall biosynthesis